MTGSGSRIGNTERPQNKPHGALRFVLGLSLLGPLVCAGQSPPSLDARRKALADLLAEQWEYNLRTNPIAATVYGDKRYNDQLGDFSEEAVERDLREARKFLARFEAIDTTGFPEQEALNKELMVRDLGLALEGARFKPWEMPVSQMDGIHILLPMLVTFSTFDSVKDYSDYISRLTQASRAIDQTMALMRHGMKDGLMPPRFLLSKVADQADAIATQAPEKSPLAQPFYKFPKSIAEDDQQRLRRQGLDAIRDSVFPAFARLSRFVRDEYAPKGRTEPGEWALPDGEARYAFDVRQSTTTDLTPEEIHQLGLAQVAEIEPRMLALAKQFGYKSLKEFNAAIAVDPKVHAHSRQELLDLTRKYIDRMYTQLPDLFGRLPKAKVEVLPVEEFREKEASTQYLQGTPDGSRPGRVMVVTGDFQNRLLTDVETTAYHEGVPGHHLQIAIAQEMPSLPPFRQHEFYSAFQEGWALYAERLGKEVGFYQDPYSYYGHLQDDMLRAVRLVVDTGFHYKHWTRQQVVDYFHEHSGLDEPTVQAETDRYMVWPGQALAYKIGQLEILKLRQYAKGELQDKFSIRAFHDEVLGAGALPLDVLSRRIHAWVAQQKPAKTTGDSGGTGSPALAGSLPHSHARTLSPHSPQYPSTARRGPGTSPSGACDRLPRGCSMVAWKSGTATAFSTAAQPNSSVAPWLMVGDVDQVVRLEAARGSLPAQMTSGDLPQFAIGPVHHSRFGFQLAIPEGAEKTGDVAIKPASH